MAAGDIWAFCRERRSRSEGFAKCAFGVCVCWGTEEKNIWQLDDLTALLHRCMNLSESREIQLSHSTTWKWLQLRGRVRFVSVEITCKQRVRRHKRLLLSFTTPGLMIHVLWTHKTGRQLQGVLETWCGAPPPPNLRRGRCDSMLSLTGSCASPEHMKLVCTFSNVIAVSSSGYLSAKVYFFECFFLVCSQDSTDVLWSTTLYFDLTVCRGFGGV